jgi:hypothetical protein
MKRKTHTTDHPSFERFFLLFMSKKEIAGIVSLKPRQTCN